MTKHFRDAYLLVAVVGCIVCSLVAMNSYRHLPTPLKQIVFASVFLSPALVLYGCWKFSWKEKPVYPAICVLGGLVATVIWVVTINSWMSSR